MNIYIKYNPYKIQTEIKINNKEVEQDSFFNIEDGKRLQEWVEEFPSRFSDYYQSNEANIEFYGTLLDFEDLNEIIEEANNNGYNFELQHIPPKKEIKDIEKNLDLIYQKIQNSEFKELKSPALINAYNNAKKSDFEVSVMATMSSGKSTLINALLGQKLMPAKNEACTAIITRIKDNNEPIFKGEVFNKKGKKIASYPEVTLKNMEKINEDEEVSEIKLEGNIPFLTADETALVLVDTPGPNNSRNEEHKNTTYRMINSSSKALVMYILNGTQLSTNDDKALLYDVAESMTTNGKQSKDRFIFVLNKVDGFRKGEDSIPGAIEKAKEYLQEFGIENPKIFPSSALMALDIRTVLNGNDDIDEDIIDEVELKVRQFNRSGEKHLEQYSKSFLPKSINKKIDDLLKSQDADGQALIHSGIISIEEYIRMYTNKYAKTAKIKNVLDSFYTALENMRETVNIKNQISESEEKREEFKIILEKLEKIINDNTFKRDLERAIEGVNFSQKLKIEANTLRDNTITRLRNELESFPTRMDINVAEMKLRSFEYFSKNEMDKLKINLEELVKDIVNKTEGQLLNIYEKQLKKLDREINEDTECINLNTFKLVSSQINLNNVSIIEECTKTEEVIVGQKEVTEKNPEREGFWGKLKFWKPKYITKIVDVKEERAYIEGKDISGKIQTEIEDNLYESVDEYIEEILKLEKHLIQNFKDKKQEIINMLNEKIEEFNKCMAEDEELENSIEKNKKRLLQLDSLVEEVNNLVEF